MANLKAALAKTKELGASHFFLHRYSTQLTRLFVAADFLNTGIKSDANARELTQLATKIQYVLIGCVRVC